MTGADSKFLYSSSSSSSSSTSSSGGTIGLATTTVDFENEDALAASGVSAGTILTLLTIAHAAIFGKRRRRDLSAVLGDNLDKPGLARDFERIYASDSNWCGMRMTCELAAKAGAPLTEEEKMMLSYFKGMVSAEDLEAMDTPQLYYSYASFVGFTKGSADKCAEMYGKCPYSAKKMMQVYRTAHSRSALRRRSRAINP